MPPLTCKNRKPRHVLGVLLGAIATYLLIACVPCLFVVFANKACGADNSRAPNLVLIMADDMGYGDLGCYGSKTLKTPHIDALARGGMKFTDFHSSGAVCSPTRAGLLTGRYQQRAGVPMVITVARHRHVGLAPAEITFAEVLKQAGYATAIFGKWHLGYDVSFNPRRQGFDRFVGYVSGNVDFISHIDQGGVYDWWHDEKKVKEEGYVTRLITRHAVKFIDDNAKRPFCLYVPHEAVHYPYQGPDDKADRFVGGAGRFNVRGSRKDLAAAYQEMTKEMDDSVGAVMAALKKHDLVDNTFVLFFSDNGATGPGSVGPLRGKKGTVWEGGHRVPCIAHWPGKIKAGAVNHDLAISLDVYPTLLAAAGVDVPTGLKLDGVNLLPALTEGKSLGERELFWGHGAGRAVRDGSWKLVVGAKKQGKRPALFNLAEDIGEKKNLASAQPDRVRKMRRLLSDWEEEVKPPPGRPGTVAQ